MTWVRRLLEKFFQNRHRVISTEEVLRAYAGFYGSFDGQIVLNHLLETVFFQVYRGTDPYESVAFNARRAVIFEILENIETARNPQRFTQSPPKEEEKAPYATG